jgi:hypothetical protein
MNVQYFKWQSVYRKMIIAHFLDEFGEVVKGVGIDLYYDDAPCCLVMINSKFTASTEFQPITRAQFIELLPAEMLELGLFTLDFLKEVHS